MNAPRPRQVTELYSGVDRALNTIGLDGRRVGDCRYGVYLFRDYDGEPIYVGRTMERIRARVRRHLTNQRTDAVAMNVLDPFEVDGIEMWPFWDVSDGVADGSVSEDEANLAMARAEYTVYSMAINQSEFGVVLNENPIPEAEPIALPESVICRILPDEIRHDRNHPDIRLARRARTMANLAGVISERRVKVGIRRTLLAQAKRLESLARSRLSELGESVPAEAGSFESSDGVMEILARQADGLLDDARALSGGSGVEASRPAYEVIERMRVRVEEMASTINELLGRHS